MDKSGRLDSASELAGKTTRERCGRCAGAGCTSCSYRGYNPVHVYAEGRGEQGEDYADLPKPSGHLHPSCDVSGDGYCFCPAGHHPLLTPEQCGCGRCLSERQA